MTPRRLVPLLGALALSGALAGSAVAAHPRNGARYSGDILEPTGNHHYLGVPFQFDVTADGRRAKGFEFPNGIPASDRCNQGPLGNPVNRLSDRPRISRSGRFDVRLELSAPGDAHAGHVRIWGRFRSHGRWRGHVADQSHIQICDATFAVTLRARR